MLPLSDARIGLVPGQTATVLVQLLACQLTVICNATNKNKFAVVRTALLRPVGKERQP